MSAPAFRTIATDAGVGVTYDCGCPCTPTATPGGAAPGFEHCCCGKVHFAGAGARTALTAYLQERAARRTKEPQYERGETTLSVDGHTVEIAWAFPRDS